MSEEAVALPGAGAPQAAAPDRGWRAASREPDAPRSARGAAARDAPWERPQLDLLHVAALPFPSPQGSQVYVRGLTRALARRGHRVRLACYGHGLGESDAEVELLRAPRPPGYRRLRSGPDPVKPLLDLALVGVVARAEADLVHAHNHEGALVAYAARRWLPAPVVYGAHTTLGDELPTYVGGPLARRAAASVGRVLDRVVPRRAAHVVALSAAGERAIRRQGCHAVTCSLPGVDPEELAPVVPAVLPPGPWVVYAGNPDAYQDLDVLVAAMHRLPDAGLLLVGASSFAGLLLAGLPRVRCVQTASFAEVRGLLAASAVAALPRARCAGFPVKLLNYLGAGLPVVAAGDSAAPLPGVVPVPPGDPAAMARAIGALLARPEQRRALGEAARQHVRTRCTWDARAVEVEQAYRQALADWHLAGVQSRIDRRYDSIRDG